MAKVRVRYAPSPTGKPHIGNIRTALFNWLFARHSGGDFLIRIEDTDRERFVEGAIETQLHALKWLGVDWDEGPDIGGPFGPYYQSQRLELYKERAEALIASGHAYRCYCTKERLDKLREHQVERGLPTGYDRRCRDLPAEDVARHEAEGTPYVVRFAMPREGTVTWTDAVFGEMSWEARILDDHVLMKSDGFPTYHMANVVDDHLMEITHVIRGEEWLPSTPRHVLMYQAFGWTHPVFVHATNILGKDRRKLSKREASAEFLNYERDGYLPEAIFNFMALLGWSTGEDRDMYTREEIIERFDLPGLVGRPAILDTDKIAWYNGVYIRALPLTDLARRGLPYLQAAGLVSGTPGDAEIDYIGRVMALEQERIKTLAEAPQLADFFLLDDDKYVFDEKAVQKWFRNEGAADKLRRVRERFESLSDWAAAGLEEIVRGVAETLEIKPAEVIHPVRVALTGRTFGPGLYETIEVLGRDRSLRRLDRAIGLIDSLV
ncbi:MAG: glutamate--tRNA ligase [Capsulimonadaceae bacterium]|nr:glutamate--tRNA ligase [Capsulimonadaceae bacterium]